MDVNDPWDPLSLEEVWELFTAAPFDWWVSGAVALELYAGRSWRSHADADAGLRRDQMQQVAAHMEAWELAVAAGGRLAPWDGAGLQDGQNNVWARRPGERVWRIDLTVGDGDDHRWIYRRDPRVTRPWAEAVLRTSDGIPFLAPDLQLLFKSKVTRPKDHQDAEEVIPLLNSESRGFLSTHLPTGHPWHHLLSRR